MGRGTAQSLGLCFHNSRFENTNDRNYILQPRRVTSSSQWALFTVIIAMFALTLSRCAKSCLRLVARSAGSSVHIRGIVGWDHHCPWMNKCIGRFLRNRLVRRSLQNVVSELGLDPRRKQPLLLQLLSWHQHDIFRLHRPRYDVDFLASALQPFDSVVVGFEERAALDSSRSSRSKKVSSLSLYPWIVAGRFARLVLLGFAPAGNKTLPLPERLGSRQTLGLEMPCPEVPDKRRKGGRLHLEHVD